jgi:AGZA family xanthine/uracil permease-like MFS transporter
MTMERLFKLRELGTNARIEIVAGLTTFMTMAYIIFANPGILSSDALPPHAKVPFAGAIAATCIAAAVPTLLMGLFTNYPIALAPGMGLNAIIAFEVATKYGWQTAMGAIFIEGFIIAVCVLTGLRQIVMDAIPHALKIAIAVGIGVFIAFLGLGNAGLVVKGAGGALMSYGKLNQPGPIIAAVGLIIMIVLMARRIRGAILLGIILTAILAFVLRAATPYFAGVVNMPQGAALISMPDLSTIARLDILAALRFGLAGTILALLMTDFFDTMGTVIAIGRQGGFLDTDGRLPRIGPVLFVDALAAMWGGFCGASSTTSYIESAAGVAAGGRTGLTSVVVAVLFVVAMFFTPIVQMVPAVAVAPALVIVGFLMMTVVSEIDFGKFEYAFPAFVTIIVIPLTQSISHGIGWGFISYTAAMLVQGKARQVHALMYAVTVLFLLTFVLVG